MIDKTAIIHPSAKIADDAIKKFKKYSDSELSKIIQDNALITMREVR